MSRDNEKIKDRVRKLLNLANDSGAFDGEIENAMRFARRLMLQHNITEEELGAPRDPHEVAAETEYAQSDAFSFGSNISNWECFLMSAISKLVGTVGAYKTSETWTKKTTAGTIVFDAKGQPQEGKRVVFYGPAEDARDASDLFSEWSHVIATMARLKYGGCFRGDGRAYAEGFAQALLLSVKNIQAEEVKEIAAESTGRALVLRNAFGLIEAKRERADQWLDKEQGIKLRKTSGHGNRNNPSAFGAGMNDGKNSAFTRTRNLKIGG